MNKTDNILLNEINEVPAIDVHTHLNASHLSARGLDDILLYHMMLTEFYSAGSHSGMRLSENPDETERTKRIEEAIPFLKYNPNTSLSWLFRIILKDLYEWEQPVTLGNWRELDKHIKHKSASPDWGRQILKKAGIVKACTELPLRGDGTHDDILMYALEWAFFTRNQWGVYDAPLYELEYASQFDAPVRPLPVTQTKRSPIKKKLKTVADIDTAMAHYCKVIPYGEIVSGVQHISTDINYFYVDTEQMQKALNNRANAGQKELDIYASYLLEIYLQELEKIDACIAFQFSFGAEPLPFETCSRLSQTTIRQLAEIIARHPKIQFQCLLSSQHTNQSLCTLSRELPNFILVGYWWHNFFPSIITNVMNERLDMLPLNKQIGLFTDGYFTEWTYAKSVLIRNILSEVLSERIAKGQFSKDTAIQIVKTVFYDTPKTLLNL